MNTKKQRAFTLIELLLVISIIGVLSSVVMGSLGSAREKARIAAGQQLDSTLKHTTGSELVGEWTFNDDTARDTSGFGSTGVLSGGTTATAGVVGRAMQFDGSSGQVDITAANNLNLGQGDFTVSLWVKTNVIQNRDIFAIPNSVGAGWLIIRQGQFSASEVVWLQTHQDGSNSGSTWPSTPALNDDKWHFITAVRDQNKIRLYMDGKLAQSATLTGNPNLNSTGHAYIARGAYSGGYFQGSVDDVRVYTKAFTTAEVARYYAEGLDVHKDLALRSDR